MVSPTLDVSNPPQNWGSLFAELPYLDALFVPAGNPGSLGAVQLFAFVEKYIPILHKSPKCPSMDVTPNFQSKSNGRIL